MATDGVPSEIIERERKKLLEILQQDPDTVLDTLTSRRLISEEEYEILENVPDPLKKSRKLLILVQKKGEMSCLHFLQCLGSTFPESATIWDLSLRHEFLKHETIEPSQSTGVSKNSEDTFFSGEKQPENPEITAFFKEKGQLDLETSEPFGDKKIRDRETALSSKEENEKVCSTPKDTFSHSVEDVEYEIPSTIAYLRDAQRDEEPDDSLYLGKEEYLGSVGYFEDAESTVEEEDYDPEQVVYYGEEDSENSEPTEFSDDEQSYEESETGMLLEEEEKKSMEERKKVFKDVLSCLNMDRSRKLLPDFVKQFSLDRGYTWTPETPGDLAWNFLMKVQALDLTARDSILRHKFPSEDRNGELLTEMENLELRDKQTINPFDVLCAAMLCSDSSLQCEVMSNMYRCQFALPLLLPDAENNKIIFMLGAMKNIVKKQSAQSSGGPAEDTEKFLAHIKMPVISFVRLGYCSFSKSKILNALLRPAQVKSHKIFLHQDSPALVLPRQISDGLVEITWCFPDGDDLKENVSFFQKPVAVANLRGDLECFCVQFGFLMEVSSAVFFFTDYVGEKEWSLLRFLGEAALEKCYFVLSPQARESEEAQIFQRILELKPSQLLFLEGEEAGDRGKDMQCLQAALQEVMCSSLRCVSMKDMAPLARELGIQVDQDCENTQGIQVSPSENMAGTAKSKGQQRHSQPKTPAQMSTRDTGVICAVSQNPQNSYSTSVFRSLPQNSWPLPSRIGGSFNQASLKSSWLIGHPFWPEQRPKCFRPFTFHNTRAHSRGKSFGFQYFQPQRFYSDKTFMKFSGTTGGCHWNGMFGRQPRPISQHAQAWPERPETMGAFGKSGAVISQVGHFHSLGLQPTGRVGKPQPGPACAQGAQLAAATEKVMRTSHIKDPRHQAFQAAGTTRKPIRPSCGQSAQQKTQSRPSNPAFQTQPYPMSTSKLSPSSQSKSNQPKHSQPQPSQPVFSQPKPTRIKPTQPQPSQPKAHQSTPTQPKPSQPNTPQSKRTQPKCSQSKSSQPRPSQPKSSWASPSQAKVYYPKAGSKKVGKH
ncbi:caspase recruitment domain-containing protein 6 [Elephas maximus indicus]|uniref:caspase recruitment domain-containing protein 6 n=1 Tax=Elephas maximus indicus TaxID=99487 RepID=UPI002116765C|nr:caspase recruitment domain-containing protein 6 [Elephas maximus indicus]